MFTGIITDIGEVRAADMRGDRHFTVACSYPAESIAIGASIACSGICLTVTDRGEGEGGTWFTADVSAETASVTTAGGWQAGTRLNLERAMKIGDELGGHIVTGHVDGLATLARKQPEGDSLRLEFDAPAALACFIAAKGSVTLDGVSLTVNAVEGVRFGVNIIPHTQSETTLGALEQGDAVNLEIDILARYVARLNEAQNAHAEG